jgi:Carboxypeptidase regulatory-like domain/TonB dependent receptor-like, beta-barrel
MRPEARKFLFCVVVCLCLAMPALAQRDMGTILGTVTDATGAVVPGAQVTIVEEGTGITNVIQTDAAGNYIRPLLKPGSYRVEVEAQGFKKGIQSGVVLESQGRAQANFNLEVGAVTETIEVTAQLPALQTESAQMGGNVASPANLPLGGQRRFAFLARTVPAVYPAEPGARDAAGGGFSANGVRSNGQNNFLLNGVDNNVNVIDFINQTSYVIGPSVEAIGEMQILTNGYNAEYGRAAGGVVNVTIKSGSNDLHGALFEFLQNDNFNANKWEANRNGNSKGAYVQNQFGAAVGGPIVKDRTFWFADYQGTRIRDGGLSNTVTIPTTAMKSGDFSGLLTGVGAGNDLLGNAVQGGMIFNPFSQREIDGTVVRDPFPNNQIPSNLFDPAAKKLIDQFPAPNQNLSANRPGSNYFTQRASSRDTNQFDVRVDHRISDNDSIFGSLSWINEKKFQAPTLPGDLDAAGFLGEQEENLSRNAMLSYSRIWSPTFITESRIAYSRLVTTRVQANADKKTFSELGIGGLDPFTTNNGGLMRISANSYSDVGGAEWLPTQEYNNVWDFIQNVSWNKGSHAFKFGAEYRPVGFPFFQVPSPRGRMDFPRGLTNQVGFADTGDGAATWLIGTPGFARITTQNFISSFHDAYSFYAQDDWKISPKLTINLGMRYEMTSPIGEKFGRQAHLDIWGIEHSTPTLVIPKGKDQDTPLSPSFATSFPGIDVERGIASTYLIKWDKTNWAPRIGAAYEIRPGTVIRAGYGMFYGAEENEGGNPNRGEQPPFNQEVQFNQPSDSAFNPVIARFSDGFPVDSFTRDATINFRSLYTNRRWPLVHKWNLNVQRDIGWNTIMEVAYIGSKGQRLTQNYNANRVVSDPLPNVASGPRRPVQAVGNVDIQGTNSFGRSNYDALTAKLEKRFSDGVQFTTAYTWGHALTDVGSPLSEGPGTRTVNISEEYSHASFDVRHRFVMSGGWELPVGKTLSGPAKTLIAGWQLNGILTLQTGNPMSIGSSQGICSCSGDIRPDPVSGKDPNAAPSGGRTPEQWMDITAFQNPAPGTYGALGNYSNFGPPTKTLDLSLFKDFAINERYSVQFRAETFNLTNTPQFSRPARTQGNGDFGLISSTQDGTNRQWQFALRFMF